jgi:hypothetical protein
MTGICSSGRFGLTDTITTTTTSTQQSDTESHARQIVNLGGNVHGFGNAPAAPAQTMPQTDGHVLGSGGPVSAQNQTLRELALARMARQAQNQAAPSSSPASSGAGTADTVLSGGSSTDDASLNSAGSGSFGRRGSSTLARLDWPALQELLWHLQRARGVLLNRLLALLEEYQQTPLLFLEHVEAALLALQREMQELEYTTALRIAGPPGPPGDPGGHGSSSTMQEGLPRSIRVTLRPSPARLRFQEALAQIQALSGQLQAGQAERAQTHQNFLNQIAALAGHSPPIAPTMNWQLIVQRHANFQNAIQQLTLNPPPAQPNQAHADMANRPQNFLNARNALQLNPPPAQPNQAHADMANRPQNFVNARNALQLNPPPAQPNQAHVDMANQPQNFLNARNALQLNPPPAQPTAAWRNMVNHHQRFQAILHQLQANPPLPLLQGPLAANNNNAPAPYIIPNHAAQHILHGNHAGGQHMGHYNPGLHGAAPNAVTQFHFPGHHVTYFPVAWDAHDILSAIQEAAEGTYHLAVQQANGNWRHPAVWVSRRGITIRVVVVTAVRHHQLVVVTGWAQ